MAVVSSGYFLSNSMLPVRLGTAFKACNARSCSSRPGDGAVGSGIRHQPARNRSLAGFRTFGLSTWMVYDVGSDQVDRPRTL